MKSSYRWARPLSKKAQGEVDGLLGAVSKLSLCRSTRSAVGICFTISDRRGRPNISVIYLKTIYP